MITLPDHVEFLSDAWLGEARRFLERQAAQRKEALGGRRFSVSERFTDAPPHLGMPGDIAAWALRYDGETVQVARGFDPAADLVVEGDYQAGLTAAQFVGVLAPGAMRALFREVAQMCGADALRARGELAEPTAREVLAVLHDHMGRRTVENPDL